MRSFENCVVVASANIFSTSSSVVMLSRRFSFFNPFRFLYRAIKGTSEYSTKEMSVFLDGIISECQEVGIETDTPEQIARYKEEWGR